MKTIKFIGKTSSDDECFCWEVDKENFIKVTGKYPEWYDYAEIDFSVIDNPKPNSDIIRIYPDHLFDFEEGLYEIEINFKKIK